jgi:hypothetical protein
MKTETQLGSISTPTASQGKPLKNQTKEKPVTSAPAVITLAEALAIVNHLTQRGLLCTICGHGWGQFVNTYSVHCATCKSESANYTETRKGAKFEKVLCESLERFVAAFISGNRGVAGNPADCKGNQ